MENPEDIAKKMDLFNVDRKGRVDQELSDFFYMEDTKELLGTLGYKLSRIQPVNRDEFKLLLQREDGGIDSYYFTWDDEPEFAIDKIKRRDIERYGWLLISKTMTELSTPSEIEEKPYVG